MVLVKRTPELMEEILERVSNGELHYAMWQAEPERMPSMPTLGRWRGDDPAFDAAYQRAQYLGAEAIAASAIAIMDAEPERILVADSEGNYTKQGPKRDGASVAWQRNRAEIRLKYAPFFNPRFNPKLDIGSDPERPVKVEDEGGLASRIALALRARARGEEPPPVLIEHKAEEPDGSDLV